MTATILQVQYLFDWIWLNFLFQQCFFYWWLCHLLYYYTCANRLLVLCPVNSHSNFQILLCMLQQNLGFIDSISDFLQVIQVQIIFTKNPKSTAKKTTLHRLLTTTTSTTTKDWNSVCCKVLFFNLSWLNSFYKQINKESLTKLLHQFSSSPMTKQIDKWSLK